MNIALVTTRYTLEENKRIEEEIKALGHGFEIIDLKDFEYGVVNNKLEVPQLVAKNFDVVIIRGIFNSVKAISIYFKDLRKKGVKIFDNNFLEHRYSINKVADVLKLSLAGIPLPDSFHLHSYENYFKSAEKTGYPVICKLTRTGKGARVFKLNNPDELKNFITDLEEREVEPKSYMLQKFIDYEHDLRILFIGNNIFCMKRIPGEGEFRANFSLGGTVELFSLDGEGKKLAKEALSAVDMTVGGVDMLIAKDGQRYILEVNHTAGFIGMEKATGQNIAKLFVEHAIAEAK